MFIADEDTDEERAALSRGDAPEAETLLFSSASLCLPLFDVFRLRSLCIALSNTAPCNSLVRADAWRETGDRGSAAGPRPQFEPPKSCTDCAPTQNGDIMCSSPSPSSKVDTGGVEQPDEGEKTKPITRRGVEVPLSSNRFSYRCSVPDPGEFRGEHRALVWEFEFSGISQYQGNEIGSATVDVVGPEFKKLRSRKLAARCPRGRVGVV